MTPKQKARLEAREHWRNTQRQWRSEGESLQQAIFQIEDSLLRWTVAALIDIMASGCGAVNVRLHKGSVQVYGFFLDADAHTTFHDGIVQQVEALAEVEDPEGEYEYDVDTEHAEQQAWCWIKDQLVGKSAVYVAWLIGRASNDDASLRTPSIVQDRIVWDLDTQSVGVLALRQHIDPVEVVWVTR